MFPIAIQTPAWARHRLDSYHLDSRDSLRFARVFRSAHDEEGASVRREAFHAVRRNVECRNGKELLHYQGCFSIYVSSSLCFRLRIRKHPIEYSVLLFPLEGARCPYKLFICFLSCHPSRLPLILMTIAYFQIVRVLWRSDTIPGHSNIKAQNHSCRFYGSCN